MNIFWEELFNWNFNVHTQLEWL